MENTHRKPHPGLGWRITSEDIDDFTDIKFVSEKLKFVGV